MNNYVVCILDKDIHYAKAFMKVVALEHAGFTVSTRSACSEGCAGEIDVCIGFGAAEKERESCPKAFEPPCGKYAGVSAILKEARAFVIDRISSGGNEPMLYPKGFCHIGDSSFGAGALLCVYAYAGGLGTSCAAIGIGRELARYRGESVVYLSLEDVEDLFLFPVGSRAMRAEEILYRYLRLLNTGAGQEGFSRLFDTAFCRDEYGLFRLAPDEGPGSLAVLSPEDLYTFLIYITGALRLTRVVLDFGTRLNFLRMFSGLLKPDEAIFIEAIPEGKEARTKRPLFQEEKNLTAAFPICEEDVRRQGGYTDVGIANAFGLAVKEICDRIAGDIL